LIGPEEVSGILIVDKAKGMTSHDVVDFIRRRFALKKVGHAGTLDPNATGVLVMLIGKATKLSDKLLNEEKEYAATMKLGERTDTGDSEGKVIAVKEVRVTQEEVRSAAACFVGEIDQVPPMVSAKSVGGQRLYKLARKGIEVAREPKRITIKKIDVNKVELPYVEFDVVCGKGTYIRQLAEDIGEKLGCGAHLAELRRSRSGDFSVERSVPFEKLGKMTLEDLNEDLIRI
jgi:tRNA pseudouridine55 synthase